MVCSGGSVAVFAGVGLKFLRRVYSLPEGGTELQQLSRFLPKGVAGLVYWYSLYPFHQYVFKGMLKGIARSVGKRVLDGPDRFAPRLPHVCRIDPKVST